MNPIARPTFCFPVGARAAALFVAFATLSCKRAPEPTPTVTSASPSAPAAVPSAPLVVAREPNALRKSFVGSAACVPCHQAQAAAYEKSHHARALVVASPDAVAGKLAGATFSTPLGRLTRFAEKNGALSVTTPDASGTSKTFSITYVAGVAPLEQYVVATEHGKLQTLGVSWDTRTAKDGGGRFFHVYGASGIAPSDSLFFTKPAQNWNYVCADCHSTLVERRYDLATDAFDTRWAELSVGCEACHGPGAEHVRAAKAGENGAHSYAATLSVNLAPSAPWTPSSTGSPTPRAAEHTEVEVCAPCHSRRQPLHEGFVAGDPLLDAFEPDLLLAGRYHADGQLDGEVYEWGSFLQSKMYASGVRCSDCHEPHAATLRAPGNALCTRCHAPARFETETHSHHSLGSAPGCVDCHMPPKTFMQIDERRDHSIRIPRPDLSLSFGTPNACNVCHAKQTPAWASEQLSKWYPKSAARPHFVTALGRDRQGALDAARALNALARDATVPAIARATALDRLARYPSKTTLETLRTALANSDGLVVFGAARGASGLPAAQRVPLLMSVISHPLRAVRIEAARGIAAVPLGDLDPQARAAIERAFADVEDSFAVSASRPESHVEKSAFELARGRSEQAEAELQTALRLNPCLAEAHLNLADLARMRKDEALAEREIRAALTCAPELAAAHHALGLLLIRTGKPTEALRSLRRAAELAPEDARFAYVLAVATADRGDVAGAVKILERVLERVPNDRPALEALISYCQRLGRNDRAAALGANLRELATD